MRGAGGVVSTITPRCVSRPTDSCSRKERRFPPQDCVPPRCSRSLPYPTVTDPEDPLLRPERHIPNSIPTMRRRLIAAIITRLLRCPCCGGRDRAASDVQVYDAVVLASLLFGMIMPVLAVGFGLIGYRLPASNH